MTPTTIIRLLPAAVALVFVAACADEEEVACPAMFTPAVVVTLTDVIAPDTKDAQVTYSQNGRPPLPATCVTPPSCKKWFVAGGDGGSRDQTGTFVITATSADGARVAETTVLVPPRGPPGDLCAAPVTQSVTLTLK